MQDIKVLSYTLPFQIIAVSGKLGSGKDYVATHLMKSLSKRGHKVLQIALADHFKVETIVKDNFSYDEVFYNKTEKSREFLQKRGTELGRNVYGENVWIDILKNTMRLHHERSGIDIFIILDVRFKNEADSFKALGTKILRLDSPKRNHKKLLEESKGNFQIYQKLASHSSENDLDDYSHFDFFYYNDKDGLSDGDIENFIRILVRPGEKKI